MVWTILVYIENFEKISEFEKNYTDKFSWS